MGVQLTGDPPRPPLTATKLLGWLARKGVANLSANHRCELPQHQRQNAYQQCVPGCVPLLPLRGY